MSFPLVPSLRKYILKGCSQGFPVINSIQVPFIALGSSVGGGSPLKCMEQCPFIHSFYHEVRNPAYLLLYLLSTHGIFGILARSWNLLKPQQETWDIWASLALVFPKCASLNMRKLISAQARKLPKQGTPDMAVVRSCIFFLLQLRQLARVSWTEQSFHAPAWSSNIKAQWALVTLCFQCDVHATACKVPRGMFSLVL